MEHVYWLIDGLLAGRQGPVQAPWDLEAIRAAGVRIVVSLNTEPDPAEIAAAGLRHCSLPMTPALPIVVPAQDLLLRQLEPVLETIHAGVGAGQPVLIHCHAGKDRTGLVFAAYLVRYRGLNVDGAIARVRAVQPVAMSAPGYEATARRFAEQERERADA
jgi:protein-tyrosine phosphatase